MENSQQGCACIQTLSLGSSRELSLTAAAVRGCAVPLTAAMTVTLVRARGVWRNELEEEEGGAIADSGLQQVPATPALPCPALQHELGWHQRRYAHDNAVHLAARTYVTPPPSSTSEHSACLPLMHSVQSAK